MRQSELTASTVYALPGPYNDTPGRPVETDRLWTVEPTRDGRRLIPAPQGARQSRNVGRLVITTQNHQVTDERYGSMEEAAGVIASLKIPRLSYDPDTAARQAESLDSDMRRGGLQLSVSNSATWQRIWDITGETDEANASARCDKANRIRTEMTRLRQENDEAAAAAAAAWTPLAARLETLGISHTPHSGFNRGDAVTTVTIDTAELAKLLDLIIDRAELAKLLDLIPDPDPGTAAEDPATGELPEPPAPATPSRTETVEIFQDGDESYTVFRETHYGKHTFGVRQTASPHTVMVAGRSTQAAAKLDALEDIRAFQRAMGENSG